MSKVPVITGIGHDVDQTVADIVAHTVLKTPTAVADWLIAHNVDFESQLLYLEDQIISKAKALVIEHSERLEILSERLKQIPSTTLSLHAQLLTNMESVLESHSQTKLVESRLKLESAAEKLELLNPENVLERGYAIVRAGKRIIPDVASLKNRDSSLEINFRDGKIKVNKV